MNRSAKSTHYLLLTASSGRDHAQQMHRKRNGGQHGELSPSDAQKLVVCETRRVIPGQTQPLPAGVVPRSPGEHGVSVFRSMESKYACPDN